MAPAALTAQLLDRMAAHPSIQGAPILDAFAPGLTDGEIDELTEPLPFRLPEELRVLWRWHNGVTIPEAFVFASWDMISLQEAIETYWFQLKIAAENAEEFGPGWYFPAHFFPFAMHFSDVTAADCSEPARPRVPVHHLPSHDVREDYIATPEVASVGEWATWQLRSLDEGYLTWDADASRWSPRSIVDDERPHGPAFLGQYRGWR